MKIDLRLIFGFIGSAAVIVMTSGCITLHSELPSSRFESPEANGVTRRFQLNTSLMQAQNDRYADDASARPPDFSSTTLTNDTVVGVGGSFGVFNHLDVGLRTTTGPSPYIVSLKFQFIGPAQSEAKAGDFSAAITAAIGGGGRDVGGDQNGLFGRGGYGWSAKMNNTLTDIALIVGTRVETSVLLYGGAFYSNYQISATLNQDASSDGLSPAASYSINTTGYQRGGNIGFQFFLGPPFFIQLEGVYSDTHASNLTNSALRGSGAIGWFF